MTGPKILLFRIDRSPGGLYSMIFLIYITFFNARQSIFIPNLILMYVNAEYVEGKWHGTITEHAQ